MSENYQTTQEWYKHNRHQLKQYRGQWIAYTKDGIIAHHPNFREMIDSISDQTIDFVIEKIDQTEYMTRPKFYPVRFRSVKQHEWSPKYDVLLKGINTIAMKIVIDSGADFGLIPLELGKKLGFSQTVGEKMNKGDGIGGSVDYLLREVNITINGHSFNAPFAWIQDENCDEILIGREVVFDLFDIEFKQADEIIIFKFRGNETSN